MARLPWDETVSQVRWGLSHSSCRSSIGRPDIVLVARPELAMSNRFVRVGLAVLSILWKASPRPFGSAAHADTASRMGDTRLMTGPVA